MVDQCGHIVAKCTPSCAEGEYDVMVFDSANRMIAQARTTQGGTAKFPMRSFGEYRVHVRSRGNMSPQAANRWLYFYPGRTCTLYFLFHPTFLKPCFTTADFRLTDRNYDGLPIQKGDILLCQAHIQSI